MKNKLVLVWVDNSGFELTGRYRDRFRQYPETRVKAEAKACCFGDDTKDMLERIKRHVELEAKDHVWMGYFSLPDNDNILNVARAKALAEYK